MNIDLNRLERNYQEQPLKRGEILSEADLRYLFLELNLSTYNIGAYLNKNAETIRKWCVSYGLKKETKQIYTSKEKTYQQKTGYINAMQDPKVLEQRKENCLKRTGYDHPMQNPNNKCCFRDNNPMLNEQSKQKLSKTIQERYGTTWYTQTESFKEQAKQTLLETVGVDNAMKCDEYKEHYYKTCEEHYGSKHPTQTDTVREKTKITNQERYGHTNVMNNKEVFEKAMQTRIIKYGDTRLFGTESFIQKSQQTAYNHYGHLIPAKTQEVKEKTRQNNLAKYGTEWPIAKIMETKRRNNTFHTSDVENTLFDTLQRHVKVLRQYSSDDYPFSCDFYLPELDLYIEFNGTWTHGGEPFENTPEQQELLMIWQEKAKTSKFYENAIYTWTNLDVRKRKTAQENNLNYLVFYKAQDLLDWIDTVWK